MLKSTRFALIVAGVATFIAGDRTIARDEEPKPFQHTSLLLVKKIYEAESAVKELAALPGVERVMRNVYTRTLTIKLNKTDPSRPKPVYIWEIAERLNLEPYRLVTAEGIYSSKPSPDDPVKSTSKTKSKSKSKSNAITEHNYLTTKSLSSDRSSKSKSVIKSEATSKPENKFPLKSASKIKSKPTSQHKGKTESTMNDKGKPKPLTSNRKSSP